MVMISSALHERVVARTHRIDYAGSALLAAGVGLLIFGTLEGGVGWPWLAPQSVGVFGLAAAALVAFIWQEGRAAEPMLPHWVFTRRLILGANVATFALGLLSIGLTTFLPTYAQGVLGVGAVSAGFILAVMSISWPMFSALSGRFYLRLGFRDTALIGAGIAIASGAIFVALSQTAPAWLAALGSFVMGAGLGLLSTPLVVGLQSVVGWERRGVVTGSYMFARQLGQAVGAAFFGSIVNAALASWLRHVPPDVAQHLPATLNVTSQVLGGGTTHLSAQAAAYVRQGIYVGTHQVFVALLVIAVASVGVLLLTPRVFTTLAFAAEEQVRDSERREALSAH